MKATKLLENVHSPVLQEVVLEFSLVSSILGTVRDLRRSGQSHPDVYKELEHALLRFSQPGIVWTMRDPLRADRNPFWTGELGNHFPSLHHCSAVILKSEIGELYPISTAGRNMLTVDIATPVGHDASLQALVASPHSKWVASGSEDSTVILWNATNGNIAQQWLTDAHESVWSLTFSLDSRYIASGDRAGKLEIRDLNQGASKVATLRGHTSAVSSCAWSPDGNMITSGSFDASVRLWDAHTFQPLHVLRQRSMKDMQYIMFSPNGR